MMWRKPRAERECHWPEVVQFMRVNLGPSSVGWNQKTGSCVI